MLITARDWETSISYGALDVKMYTIQYTVMSIPIFQSMERKRKIMAKDVLEDSQEEIDVTDYMLKEYPTLMNSVKQHMNDCFVLMAKKQMDYGMGNIGMNGNKKLALLGIMIRLNDKVQRALNMLEKDQSPNNESLDDTAKDITNYGAIFNTVLKDEWRK